METLVLDRYVTARLIAPQHRYDLGQGVIDTRRRLERPLHEFTLRLDAARMEEAEYLWGFARFHQGDREFLFDGGGKNIIETPELLGYGDGARTQFLLPFRRAIGDTWDAYVDGEELLGGFSIIEQGGILVFTSPPAEGAPVAATGEGIFVCKFWFDGEAMLDEEEFALRVFRSGITIREVAHASASDDES